MLISLQIISIKKTQHIIMETASEKASTATRVCLFQQVKSLSAQVELQLTKHLQTPFNAD